MTEELSPIQNFYNGKVLFITGATGFVGKSLLQKLLKDCPGVAHIYILLREKREKTITERAKKLFDDEIFDVVKENHPLFQDKVSPILGDIDSLKLGIKQSDIEMLKQSVNIVFHCAARIQFDDAIKLHVQSSIVATKDLIDMVKTFEHIQAFIYVSTLYCTHYEPNIVIEENVTKRRISPVELVHITKWMDDSAIRTIYPKLVDGTFIPYLFTKGVVECAIKEDHGTLPVVIVRPALISPAFKEPFPGWCVASQGIQELDLLILKGLFRVLLVKPGTRLTLIPIDMVSNAMIAAAWYISLGKSSPKDILVLNLSMDEEKIPISDTNLYYMMYEYIKKYPLFNVIRFPSFTIYHSKFLYEVHSFFDQYIPSFLADIVLYLWTGKAKMINLVRIMRTFVSSRNCATYPKRTFKMNNTNAVGSALSTVDCEKFFVKLPENFNLEEYTENFILGVRKCLGKEDLSNLEFARKKAKVWWFCTSTLKWSAIYGVCHIIGITEYKAAFYLILLKFIHIITATIF